MLTVISKFSDRFANVIQRLMSSLLFEASEDFRLPAARQLFQGADVEITIVKVLL